MRNVNIFTFDPFWVACPLIRAIAAIKVEEALEKENNQLTSCIDKYLKVINDVEEKAASRAVDLDEAKTNFDIEKLKPCSKI